MCSFGSCQTRFEFLSQFRKVRNAFECFVTQVQTHLPKTKRVWPMKINVICAVVVFLRVQFLHFVHIISQIHILSLTLLSRVAHICARIPRSYSQHSDPPSSICELHWVWLFLAAMLHLFLFISCTDHRVSSQ